jgi:broad specificity phosphatase PhoE
MKTRLIRWLRHAESQSNAGEKTSYPEEIALTARGRAEAVRFAAAWNEAPDLIAVSGFVRAGETAAPLLERFPDVHHICLPVHELTFLCPARCRVTSFEERRAMVEEYWERGDPLYVDGPGAESFSQFRDRVQDSISQLIESSWQNILIVSHAQVMQLARAASEAGSFYSISMSDFRELRRSRPIANLELIETHGY